MAKKKEEASGRVRITAKMSNGTEVVSTGNASSLFGAGARAAFERRFQTSTSVLDRYRRAAFNDDGTPKKDEEIDHAELETTREEWVQFFMWRFLAKNGHPDLPEFEDFIDDVDEFEQADAPGGEADVNPTAEAAPSGQVVRLTS